MKWKFAHCFQKNTIIKLFACICFLVLFIKYTDALKIITERAIVKYSNPKYITNFKVFTSRRRRQDPYTTNLTATIPFAYGSNVTFSMSYGLPSGNLVDLNIKLCDILDKPWMMEFMKMYSNISTCPSPAGTYNWFNVEIPPKNFPLPIPPNLKKGDKGRVNFGLFRTKDKERIVDMYCYARVV